MKIPSVYHGTVWISLSLWGEGYTFGGKPIQNASEIDGCARVNMCMDDLLVFVRDYLSYSLKSWYPSKRTR